jgi:hypothetical protein
VVATAAGNSEPYLPQVVESDLGVFSVDGSGCGHGAVLNVSTKGDLSFNSPANTASPGDYIAIFGTGLGLVTPMPQDGSPTPLSPLAQGPGGGPLYEFLSYPFAPLEIWGGRAPGLIGVDQFNAPVPLGLRDGCAVPVQLVEGGNVSQPVTFAVRKGGGPCTDPPEAGYGEIAWERTINSTAAHAVSETDSATVSLQASPGKQARPATTLSKGPLPGSQIYFGPSCPIPGYRSLDAGSITVQGPGFGPLGAAL